MEARFIHEEEEGDADQPILYLPIGDLYSSPAPCRKPSASSNVMSKKVKASRKPVDAEEAPAAAATAALGDGKGKEIAVEGEGKGKEMILPRPNRKRNAEMPLQIYSRRDKKSRHISFFDSVVWPVSETNSTKDPLTLVDDEEAEVRIVGISAGNMKLRRNKLKNELLWLGGAEIGSVTASSDGSYRRLRGGEGRTRIDSSLTRKRRQHAQKDASSLSKDKKWVELEIEGADPQALVGLACKVYWPADDVWYPGSITEYNSEKKKHDVKYDDGDTEHLTLLNEKIKFNISTDLMRSLNLKCLESNTEKKGIDYDELFSLAISFGAGQDREPGDVVWGKLTGHAMWPAVVVNESNIIVNRHLTQARRESILVQFFGTHDFARINLKQAIPFVNGMSSSLYLKCKHTRFYQSLDEVKMYFIQQDLPKSMLWLQKGIREDNGNAFGVDDEGIESCEGLLGDEVAQNMDECVQPSPIEIEDLLVTNLGKIVTDSEYFHDKQRVWPDGYTAFRKFTSIKDPNSFTKYKMEVLRHPKVKTRPLFRVTSDDGVQIDGLNPAACWKEIYSRIRKNQRNGFHAEADGCSLQKSGSYMFGFSNPKISQLIQGLPSSRSCLKNSLWELPAGCKPINVDWRDLDRCSVCHMDEEYEENLFLQCDKCRMMVHARCYGELEPVNGVLWLCNLCRPGAPRTPLCCLCPVIGGAIKPTTDGRWAHLACAMWIPETCLLDVKRMEPIDGLSRISKGRWKLICSICNIPYGACIQCYNSTCRVAYHPLCARAAGLCVELEDEDLIHLMSLDDEDGQCIRLMSFCKKHRQPSNDRTPAAESLQFPVRNLLGYIPASNPSGCARTEPYNSFGRRGQREPQVLAAASVKRLYVENRPYLVRGCCQNGVGCSSGNETLLSSCTTKIGDRKEDSVNIFSMAEKYNIMKATFRKRLAFGKSRIHGFGVFAKHAHKAGDMVIEYTGEIVRPSVADIRERRVYNSLVGAGTYMFRIDDERVIDATRAGSIAHLINHSCEPNCYSRVISVKSDEHIVIFAKRDIKLWEELTYDYRFFSIDEQLACYCGFPRCRGVVNDTEAEEQLAKIWAPRSDLIHWRGD